MERQPQNPEFRNNPEISAMHLSYLPLQQSFFFPCPGTGNRLSFIESFIKCHLKFNNETFKFLFDPFMLNVFSHPYQSDNATSDFRIVGWYFSFLFKF